MTIKCIAVDDECYPLEALITYCKETPCLELVKTFSDPYDAIKYLNHNSPDLVFLDVQMPHINGIEIAKKIRDKTMIIFTTAYSEYAVDGFNVEALDYLLKPFDFDRFSSAIEKVKNKIELERSVRKLEILDDYIVIKVEYVNIKIFVSDILYIEGLDNYSKIHTKKKTYLPRMNLKSVFSILPENKFVRIHKSYIVPIFQVNHFNNYWVSIQNISLPVGRAYSKKIMAKLKS